MARLSVCGCKTTSLTITQFHITWTLCHPLWQFTVKDLTMIETLNSLEYGAPFTVQISNNAESACSCKPFMKLLIVSCFALIFFRSFALLLYESFLAASFWNEKKVEKKMLSQHWIEEKFLINAENLSIICFKLTRQCDWQRPRKQWFVESRTSTSFPSELSAKYEFKLLLCQWVFNYWKQ